jgi:GT2 family glycosyltransferase
VVRAALDDDVDYLYSDEDHINLDGHVGDAFHKPDWSPERFRSQMYTCHLSVLRRSLVQAVGAMRAGFDGAQDYDLVLRVVERARRIVHIPEALYHWRMGEASVVGNTDAKPYAFEAGRRAVQEHCRRVGIAATVEHGRVPGVYRVRRELPRAPLVSVVIPTRGSTRSVWGVERNLVIEAVRSIVDRATYPHLEFVVVADTATPDAVITELRRLCGDRVTLVPYDRPFHFSEKMNLGVTAASGELLLLLNDDVEPIDADAIETMAALAMDDTVGMVGARLLFADDRLQHGGHVYAIGEPRHAFFGHAGDELGPGFLLAVQRECSGVTAACAMLRAEVFDSVGGFSTVFPNNFNDVDLSLKIRRAGLRIVWTPYASWYHFESQTRAAGASDEELAALRNRWMPELCADPYFSPRLDQMRDDWAPALTDRPHWRAGGQLTPAMVGAVAGLAGPWSTG